jgi:hypothetical protein
MKRVDIVFFICSLIIFNSCKKDGLANGAPIPLKPIAATVSGSMADNGTFNYYPKSVTFLHDTLSILAVDTIPQSNQTCDGFEQIMLIFKAKSTGSIALAYGSVTTYGYCSMNSFWYTTDSTHTGSVNVTMLDTINHIASGTFSFSGEMQTPMRYGGTNTVSNGSFNKIKW